jgi:hypothetical protein
MPTHIDNPREQWPQLSEVQIDFMQFVVSHTRRLFEVGGLYSIVGSYQIPPKAHQLTSHFVICELNYFPILVTYTDLSRKGRQFPWKPAFPT